MSGIDAIRVTGTVIEALPQGRFRVQLANGHRLVARVMRRDADRLSGIRMGDELDLRVSPGDMAHGSVDKVLKTRKD